MSACGSGFETSTPETSAPSAASKLRINRAMRAQNTKLRAPQQRGSWHRVTVRRTAGRSGGVFAQRKDHLIPARRDHVGIDDHVPCLYGAVDHAHAQQELSFG